MSNTIHAEAIASALRDVIDAAGAHEIVWDAPIGHYLSGGAGASAALAATLNRSRPFRDYDLALGPEDLADAETLRGVLSAIIRWFQTHGWRVVAR
jgi:asparagine synthetase B (glutamine-hydrolysing)